jgi:hypothetical protein
MDKHINFFELKEAAEKPGCPLCRIVADRAERYIDNMLFEHVSDRGFRRAYREAGGFCSFHSRRLSSFRDGLAVAILGRDLLEDRIAHFRKRKPWRPGKPCPICEERDRIEHEYLGFIAGCSGKEPSPGSEDAAGDEAELIKAFTASSGFCAPHYGKLLESFKKIPPWLVEFHERKFASLKKRTDRFIEFSAYGREEEWKSLPEEDQLVWKELAAVLRGEDEPGD